MLRKFWLTVILVLLSSNAFSQPTTFFAEDLNTTNDPLTVADDPERIAHPNSDAARTAFFSNLLSPQTESFEALTVGATSPIAVMFGSTTATITGNATVVEQPSGTFNGTYPISGTKFVLSQAGGGSTFTLTFSAPQAAFGFYGTDIGEAGQLTVTLTPVSGSPTVLPVPHTIPSGSGSVLYFAVIDTENPFTSVTFGNTSAIDGFGFDDFTIGAAEDVVPPTPAPEPPQILNGPPPNGMVGVPYSFAYTSTGSPTFSVTAGSLPPGLTLSPSGVISGTPTAPGTFTGTVTASNGTAPDATQNFSITIAAAAAPIPTLGEWGSILLMIALLGAALLKMR